MHICAIRYHHHHDRCIQQRSRYEKPFQSVVWIVYDMVAHFHHRDLSSSNVHATPFEGNVSVSSSCDWCGSSYDRYSLYCFPYDFVCMCSMHSQWARLYAIYCCCFFVFILAKQFKTCQFHRDFLRLRFTVQRCLFSNKAPIVWHGTWI